MMITLDNDDNDDDNDDDYDDDNDDDANLMNVITILYN